MYYSNDAFKVGWRTWLGITVVLLILWGTVGFIVSKLSNPVDPTEDDILQHEILHSLTIYGEDMKEEVECEYDPPLKHVTLIMHWYDSHAELNFDYQTLIKQDDEDPEEVWGWSNCMWQPGDSWAACDIYTVVPTFVHADQAMDTLGHEVLHASCGGFHAE